MGRHRYDFDPTPERPAVRLYPHIPWFNSAAAWIRDDGSDSMDQDIIAEVRSGITPKCFDCGASWPAHEGGHIVTATTAFCDSECLISFKYGLMA